MAVIKVNKTKDYTIMSNTHFRERDMSLKAKGLLSLMLSLPSDWDYSVEGLVAICKENETAITSTLKELKMFGYLSVTKVMPNETQSGRIEYVYEIFETPQRDNIQGIENQGVEKQGIENLPLVLQKEKSTKKEKDIYIYSNIIEEENTKDKKEKESIKEKPHRTRKEFVPPTYEEVLEYAKSRGREDLAKVFYDGYSVADWHNSYGKKITNWKQTFIQVWENNNTKTNNSTPQRSLTSEQSQSDLDKLFDEVMANGRKGNS
jgi:hypothetical protein